MSVINQSRGGGVPHVQKVLFATKHEGSSGFRF
jgi:hypothetical protein